MAGFWVAYFGRLHKIFPKNKNSRFCYHLCHKMVFSSRKRPLFSRKTVFFFANYPKIPILQGKNQPSSDLGFAGVDVGAFVGQTPDSLCKTTKNDPLLFV